MSADDDELKDVWSCVSSAYWWYEILNLESTNGCCKNGEEQRSENRALPTERQYRNTPLWSDNFQGQLSWSGRWGRSWARLEYDRWVRRVQMRAAACEVPWPRFLQRLLYIIASRLTFSDSHAGMTPGEIAKVFRCSGVLQLCCKHAWNILICITQIHHISLYGLVRYISANRYNPLRCLVRQKAIRNRQLLGERLVYNRRSSSI